MNWTLNFIIELDLPVCISICELNCSVLLGRDCCGFRRAFRLRIYRFGTRSRPDELNHEMMGYTRLAICTNMNLALFVCLPIRHRLFQHRPYIPRQLRFYATKCVVEKQSSASLTPLGVRSDMWSGFTNPLLARISRSKAILKDSGGSITQ